MILDALLIFADGQTTTYSSASTNYVDTLATGENYQQSFFYARVDTLFVAGAGTPYASFQLQTSEVSTFGEYTVLTASTTLPASSLIAGYTVKAPVPAGVKRYLRGYLAVTGPTGYPVASGEDTNYFSTAVYDMFIVKDVDIDNSLAG